jgi:molecular chaperone GrpE
MAKHRQEGAGNQAPPEPVDAAAVGQSGAPSGKGGEPPQAGEGAAAAEQMAGEGARIAALEAENAELKDQYLRKAADFENFRKRVVQEKLSAIEFANQSLILDLIPVIDDLERAVKAAESALSGEGAAAAGANADFKALYEGISMIEKRLVSVLESKWGLKRFDSAGAPFDPNKHEAIMMETSPDAAEAVVKDDLIKGYTLKDRVIRAAKVKVVMPQ